MLIYRGCLLVKNSFVNISEVNWQCLHSLGTRSGDDFEKVSIFSVNPNLRWKVFVETGSPVAIAAFQHVVVSGELHLETLKVDFYFTCRNLSLWWCFAFDQRKYRIMKKEKNLTVIFSRIGRV